MTLPPSHPDLDLLDRYLAGNISSEDRETVTTWLADDPFHAELLDAMRHSGWLAGERSTRWSASEEWERLRQEMRAEPEWVSAQDTMRRIPTPRVSNVGFAGGRTVQAAFLTVLAALLVMFGIRHFHVERAGDPSGTAIYTTALGQRANVTLKDGTRITLAPQTTLSVASNFGRATRSVRLSGEAFFAVHDAGSTPFQVQAGAVMTRVLGTVFTVRRYPTDTAVQVMVETGRVVTGGPRARVTLAAGDVARATDSTTTVLRGGGPSELVDWSNNMLVFRDTPVPEMLATVARWYGVEFRLMDSTLTAGRVSAEINVADRDETFKVLQAVLGASLTFDGRVVVLSRRHEVPPVRRALLPEPVRADRGAAKNQPTREMGR